MDMDCHVYKMFGGDPLDDYQVVPNDTKSEEAQVPKIMRERQKSPISVISQTRHTQEENNNNNNQHSENVTSQQQQQQSFDYIINSPESASESQPTSSSSWVNNNNNPPTNTPSPNDQQENNDNGPSQIPLEISRPSAIQPTATTTITLSSVTPMETDTHTSVKEGINGQVDSVIRTPVQDEQRKRDEVALVLTSMRSGLPPDFGSVQDLFQRKEKKFSLSSKLPVKTMKELDELEYAINNDEELKTQLLYRLAKIGGKNFGQHVRNGLKALMTDSIAVQFNWAGRGGKKAFQSYEIRSVLFDSIRIAFPQVTDFQLKDPVQCWLKRSRAPTVRRSKVKKPEITESSSRPVAAM